MKKMGPVILAILILGGIAYNAHQLTLLSNRVHKIETRLGGESKLGYNQKDTVDRVRKSVVRIIGGESSGSGFAVQEKGYILTNFHVIAFEPSPKVILPDGTFETAQVIMADKDADLAVVKINKDLPLLKPANLKDLGSAEELMAVGYALSGDLPGESSVSTGHLSARRKNKNGLQWLETDMTLIEGMSGGPMVNIRGEVVGVSTAAYSAGGMGIAISVDSVKHAWHEMIHMKDPLKDVQKVEFEPNKNPLEAVRCFYNYLKCRKLEKAFALLSDNFVSGYSFEQWTKGYEPLLDTTVVAIWPDKKIQNRIGIKLITKDIAEEGKVISKAFEGYWDVRKVNGKWLLWHPKIREVKEPGLEWFPTEDK